MKTFTIIAAFGLIAPSLAVPCVTQMNFYQVNRPDQRMDIVMCWDTENTSCKGTAKDLIKKPGGNSINTCTNDHGKIHWHLATGWTLFGHDVESQDVKLQVGTIGCSVDYYEDLQVKFFDLPFGLWRTDNKPEAISHACPF
ncbi:hypothetical protein J1614_008490 [Plenodomus biglobosus]|nr:hypothetical protein J1614_008490 [Plenodomus biglobosus]